MLKYKGAGKQHLPLRAHICVCYQNAMLSIAA